MRMISKNQYGGFRVLFLAVMVVVGLLVIAWAVHERSSEQSQLTLANKANVNYKSLNSKDIARLKANNAAPEPAPPAEETPATQTPGSTSPSAAPTTQPKQTITPPAVPGSTTAPSLSSGWKISFSQDGCIATIVAEPGASVEIGAHTATKGGSVQYTVPASGTLIKSSGGFKGMTSYAKAINSSNNYYGEATITTDQCAPAG
jgi:hypothetical protein